MNPKKSSLTTKQPLRRKTPLRAKRYPKPKEKTVFDATEVKTKKRQPSRKTLMDNADAAFSLFIRTRDSQAYAGRSFVCISCNRPLPIEQADCGPYINRSHMSLRFSELNCNAQCRHCNRFQEGNFSGYRQGLIRKIGEPKVLLLEAQKNITNKISNFELAILAKHYKEETKKFEYQIK